MCSWKSTQDQNTQMVKLNYFNWQRVLIFSTNAFSQAMHSFFVCRKTWTPASPGPFGTSAQFYKSWLKFNVNRTRQIPNLWQPKCKQIKTWNSRISFGWSECLAPSWFWKCDKSATRKMWLSSVHRYQPEQQKSETRMAASVLKQDPNTEKIQKNAYLLWHRHTICKLLG